MKQSTEDKAKGTFHEVKGKIQAGNADTSSNCIPKRKDKNLLQK